MLRTLRLSHLAVAAAIIASPLLAQNSNSESVGVVQEGKVIEASVAADAASPQQCEAAQQRLTELQSQEDVLWSSQTEAADLYRIWSSPICVSARRGASNIKQELASAMLLLATNGTDLEAELQSETAKCDRAAAAKWNSETAYFKRQHSKTDLAATCMLNMRLTLFGKAMSQLNQSNAESYADAQTAYEAAQQARLDQIAADKAAYAAERAEWERRSKLCLQGKRKYCAAE